MGKIEYKKSEDDKRSNLFLFVTQRTGTPERRSRPPRYGRRCLCVHLTNLQKKYPKFLILSLITIPGETLGKAMERQWTRD